MPGSPADIGSIFWQWSSLFSFLQVSHLPSLALPPPFFLPSLDNMVSSHLPHTPHQSARHIHTSNDNTSMGRCSVSEALTSTFPPLTFFPSLAYILPPTSECPQLLCTRDCRRQGVQVEVECRSLWLATGMEYTGGGGGTLSTSARPRAPFTELCRHCRTAHCTALQNLEETAKDRSNRAVLQEQYSTTDVVYWCTVPLHAQSATSSVFWVNYNEPLFLHFPRPAWHFHPAPGSAHSNKMQNSPLTPWCDKKFTSWTFWPLQTQSQAKTGRW